MGCVFDIIKTFAMFLTFPSYAFTSFSQHMHIHAHTHTDFGPDKWQLFAVQVFSSSPCLTQEVLHEDELVVFCKSLLAQTPVSQSVWLLHDQQQRLGLHCHQQEVEEKPEVGREAAVGRSGGTSVAIMIGCCCNTS